MPPGENSLVQVVAGSPVVGIHPAVGILLVVRRIEVDHLHSILG
jgi:hypothetical protein